VKVHRPSRPHNPQAPVGSGSCPELRRIGRTASCTIALLSILIYATISHSPAATASTPHQTSATTSTSTPTPPPKFILHKFEQPIGEETYIESTASVNAAPHTDAITFQFTDRGSHVPLTAKFTSAADLTPESFEIRGRNARTAAIDESVEVHATQIRSRIDQTWTDSPRPAQFFTIAGYAPATMQMRLIQFWASHGEPKTLKTYPQGEVKISRRGQDTITLNAQPPQQLVRYTIEGLIWGRETLWFDANLQLIALISVDAEFDHFEAIRDGYESALSTFVQRAGEDEMSALSDFGKTIAAAQSESFAIVGGTLIDGTGRAPIADSAIVVHQGKIVAAGARKEIKLPKNAKIIDATGKHVLPGLWDMHAHFEQVEWGPIYLAAGVTTVRDCGNELEFITAVRDAIAAGRGLGPQILAAGIVDGNSPFALGVERVTNPDQAKEWVDRYHSLNFQQMKIYSSVTRDNVAAVATEAHRLGMTVTGHIPEGMTAYDGVNAGMDQINHIQYIANVMHKPLPPNAKRIDRLNATANIDLQSPEAQKAIAFLKSHGTVIDPTLVVFESFTVGPDRTLLSLEPGVAKVAPELATQLNEGGAPPDMRELERKIFAKYIAITGELHRAGIPIVAGTDQSVPGFSIYREMELYVEAGFTPMEALQAATIVPARVMKLDADRGTLEPGKRADIILVDGDPLENIHNIRNVKTVIASGTIYDTAPLWRSAGFKP
jgi:imidazolonepropionase-like amidohydrolase